MIIKILWRATYQGIYCTNNELLDIIIQKNKFIIMILNIYKSGLPEHIIVRTYVKETIKKISKKKKQ